VGDRVHERKEAFPRVGAPRSTSEHVAAVLPSDAEAQWAVGQERNAANAEAEGVHRAGYSNGYAPLDY
jgi:hypothetical protein